MYWDGKRGERIFRDRMRYQGFQVEDVRKDPEYWMIDIDFMITNPNTGNTRGFEVKYDSKIHTTNNLYLELTNIHSKQWNGEGWWPHCEADFLVYGDQQVNKFYVIPLLELRERVKQLNPKVAQCGWESTGMLVSLDDIRDLIITEV